MVAGRAVITDEHCRADYYLCSRGCLSVTIWEKNKVHSLKKSISCYFPSFFLYFPCFSCLEMAVSFYDRSKFCNYSVNTSLFPFYFGNKKDREAHLRLAPPKKLTLMCCRCFCRLQWPSHMSRHRSTPWMCGPTQSMTNPGFFSAVILHLADLWPVRTPSRSSFSWHV